MAKVMRCNIIVLHIFIAVFVDFFVQADKENSKPNITERQLKEIADIKKQLNEAFERDVDMKSNGAKEGVIVQPGWTQSDAKVKGNTKVVVNDRNLKAAAAIRDEIQGAVKAGKYVTGESGHEVTQQKLNTQSRDGPTNTLGSLRKSENNRTFIPKSEIEDSEGNLPNIVESKAFENHGNLEKLQRLEMTSRRTREILVLREIVEDLSFNLGDDVKEWAHLFHAGKEFFIGLRDVDLLIIQKDELLYASGRVIDAGASISYLETFSYWNTESTQQEGFILAVIGKQVLWYQADNNKVLWQWLLGMPINSIKHFKIQQKDYIAISSERSTKAGSPSINIYQFDIKTKEFWIAQKIQLEDLCSEVVFLDTGRDVILAFVQNNSVNIYTFNPLLYIGDHLKFERKTTIQSEKVQSVSGFQMGGFSYLAIGGLSPQILHYTNGEFVPKTILGQNFGLVEMFLPVPARTYRDDMILIIQHRVDFESHNLIVLDTLIWDGEAFEASPPVPCIVSNHSFTNGVGCMLDIQRDSGIKGSAALRRDDGIFVIVPRHEAESGLFQLKIELLAKNSELLDLREIYDYLQEWVWEQDNLTEEANKFLRNRNTDIEFTQLSALSTPELIFDGDIDHIFVNDKEFTNEDMEINLEDLMVAIERAELKLSQEEDSARSRRELSYDTVDIDKVEAEELFLQLLNGKGIYLRNSELIFDGSISFEKLRVVDEIELSAPRHKRDDSLELEGDLEFEKINGISWNVLMSDLIFRNRPMKIDKVHVDGETIIEGNIEVQEVNDLRFPTDFMWSSGDMSSIVRGKKNFFGNLTIDSVDTGGLINGVYPFDVITLSEEQIIPGVTIFAQLEVSERIEVDGKVQGRGLTNFLANPSLEESNIINSACTFYSLAVDGPIIVSDKLNGENLDAALQDVAYRPAAANETIIIDSQKIFNSVTFNSDLEVKDDAISGVPLKNFVTKNTEQELEMKKIVGNVYFNSLKVAGQYDKINVGELVKDSIAIDNDSNIDGETIFENDIWAQSLEIMDSLNGQAGFRTVQDDFELDKATFKDIHAKKASLNCDITGGGTFNDISLDQETFHHNPKIHVTELSLKSDVLAEFLHNINAKLFLSFLQGVENIPAMILEGRILANHIHVDGDVQINKLNDHGFDEDIQMSAIWLGRPNFLSTNLTFEEPLGIAGDIQINGTLNKFNIPFLVDDMAFKSESPLVIPSSKTFLMKVKVAGNADIESVNELSFTEIATKQTMETFQGEMHINGDLMVENLQVFGFLNDYPLGDLGTLLRYDDRIKTFVLLGEVAIKGYRDLGDLHIDGQLNTIGNVNEFFENIVFKNRLCMLKGKTTFSGNVTIEKGAYIRYLNGYNIQQLMKNIVFVNNPKPITISAPVLFKDVVQAKGMTVKGSLTTSNFMGCQLSDWLTDTLRVDEATDVGGPLIFTPEALCRNSLHVNYLNGMNMDGVITLHSSQNISSHIRFSDVHLDDAITVEGLVSGFDLKKEFENTVKVGGGQAISTPLTMQSCTVADSLVSHNNVNGSVDIRNPVTLYENLEFLSPMSFNKVTVNNVVTDGIISGINFNKWHRNSLWTDRRHQMVVTGNWTVKNFYVESPFIGRRISGTTQRSQGNPLDEMSDKYDQLYETYSDLCQRSKELLTRTKNRIYFLKYFEKAFSIVEEKHISALFSISNTDHNYSYVIVNLNCESKIYMWDPDSQCFQQIDEFESGMIDEVVAVPSQGEPLHLVTNEHNRDLRCFHEGVNSWHFDGERVTHFRSFNNSDITTIHRSAQSEGKFYAIDERRGQVLQLTPNSNEQQAWNLPQSDSKLYRFLPHDTDLGIALANGHQILLLNEPSRRRFRRRRNSLFNRQSTLEFSSRTVIPPGKTLTFSDFRHVIMRILRDLIRRLNIQLSDINYTLAEGELDDEHLQKDFMDILESIRMQNILSPETFADLHVEELEFSSNPSQILAAKIVQIIWPVLSEVEEVHTHLRSGDDDHPVCRRIFDSLSSLLRDILAIAKFSKKGHSEASGFSNITEVLTRVKNFQREILATIDRLEKDHNSTEPKTDAPPSSPELRAHVKLTNINATLGNPLDEPFIGQAITDRNLLAADGPHLPARGGGEIVSLKTGMANNQRTLVAVTEAKEHVVAKESDSVKIFFDVITGSLFQTVSAHKPRYLTSIRIQDESLLAFVEDKKYVRVLIYRGTKGFVEFVKFKVENDVSGLIFVSLAEKKMYPCPRNYLVVSSNNKIDFYEAVMSGHCGLDGEVKCYNWVKG